MTAKDLAICKLTPEDLDLMDALSMLFGEAFDDLDSYTAQRPSASYLRRLLGSDSFIALAALKNGDLVGGIAAYELKKFEREISEIYLYDLAVASAHRRQGVAKTLIEALKEIARLRGASVIFVQAHKDIEDEPAIALYSKLGSAVDVLSFDIPIDPEDAV